MKTNSKSTKFELNGRYKTAIILGCVFFFSGVGCGEPADSVSLVRGSGRATERLTISLNGGGGKGVSVTSTETGAVAVPGGQTSAVIDFGNLSQGSTPVGGTVSVQIRGNAAYRLNVSELSYQASTLLVSGKNVSGASDRASFLKLKLGSLLDTGSRSNAKGSVANSGLGDGIPLSEISQGPVQPGSTTLCYGEAPSLGGTADSADNAVEVNFTVFAPVGLGISPLAGSPEGYFQVVLQLGVFTGSG